MRAARIGVWLAVTLGVLLGPVSESWAGTTGKIQGVVKDANSGLPLPNAAITVVGSTMGAATGGSGDFFILNVPAGTYTVQASSVGYKPVRLSNVLITPDFSTQVDFSLEPTVIEMMEPIDITAERPLLQRDATSTVRVIDSEQYAKLPTRGYQDAASLQAGVVGVQGVNSVDVQGNESTNNPVLFIRGGRANEVAYFVDGFSQQDPLTGYSTTSINNNAVEQVVVMTGGFNAEYGRIMSGAINVVTKEGSKEYFGTLEAVSDNLFGDEFANTKSYDYNVYDASFGGPVFPGKEDLTFFVSGQRRWQEDRSPRATAGGILPNNHLSGFTGQGKLTWKIDQGATLRLGTLGSSDDWREYLHTYSYNQDHMPKYEDRNNSYFATLTKDLGTKTFFNVSGNFFKTERTRGDGVAFDDLDLYRRLAVDRVDSTGAESIRTIGNPDYEDFYNLFFNTARPDTTTNPLLTTFLPGHVFDDFLHRESSYVGFSADVSHKWTDSNVLKVGGDFQRHTLRYYNHLFPARIYVSPDNAFDDVVNYGYDENFTGEGDAGKFDDSAKKPITGSFYVQNKYDSEQFVLNAGIRVDHLDPKTPSLASDSQPFGSGQDGSLDEADLLDSKKQTKISPRLGFGFPLSERSVFHANYGKFFQQPNLEDLYTSYRYLEYKVANGGYYFAFGNPNLVPETTTAYEVGITHTPTPDVRLDVTAYYKDVKDLVQVQSISSNPRGFSSYRNTDYGTIKGLDLSVNTRAVNGVTGAVNYSLSYATGTGSTSQSQRNIAWTSAQQPKLTAPLSFDQRHKVSINLDFSSGEGGGPALGDVRLLENAGLNVLVTAASGLPYTPLQVHNEVSLVAQPDIQPTGPINSRYGPWTHRVDAKATRNFGLGQYGLQAYVWVLNIFDTENQIDVYGSSGSAHTTGFLATEAGEREVAQNGDDFVSKYKQAEADPTKFGIPRMIRLGLSLSL